MYVILRRYHGAAAQADEAVRRVQEGLIPLLRDHKGFEGYAIFASDQGDIVWFLIFRDGTSALRLQDLVRSWVVSNLRVLLPTPPEVFAGLASYHAVARPQSGGTEIQLHCMVGKAENVLTVETMQPMVEKIMTAIKKSPGFYGIYFTRSDKDPARSASALFCDTREHAMAAHEAALSIMHKHQPNMNVCVAASAETAVLAMA